MAPRRLLLATHVAVAAALSSAGCATLPHGRAWGEDVTLRPGWTRVGRALEEAATSPATWGPAALAAVFQIDDWDRRASSWCAEEAPLFGSSAAAGRSSTDLLRVTQGSYLLSCLAAPSGRGAGDWILRKGAATLLGFGAIEATTQATSLGKVATGRARPDRSDDRSFPSGHASGAAVRATLAARNARAIFARGESRGSRPARAARLACEVTGGALAAGCAWARLEARKHYPSDVLVGLALGHFLGAFVNDAFITPDGVGGPALGLAATRGGFEVVLRIAP
jgi:hypothetical protein